MKPARKPTYDEYAAIDAVNFSTLKEMRKSALHYRYRLESPPEETPAMRLGLAGHTAVFEPDRFMLEYALFDGERRAGKVWEAFQAANANRTILKRNEYETCLALRDAVRAHPAAAELLRAGTAEETITWVDTATGLKCKARVDWRTLGYVVELKTTNTVDATLYGAQAARMGHHLQLAFYAAGLKAALGMELEARIIAVEQEPPHDVAVFAVDGDALEAGREECADLLRLIAECRAKKEWPGRYATVQRLALPTWVYRVPEETSGLGLVIDGQEA